MRFRLPRPLHGWRPFFGEVGIIVLGVLIALGATQLLDAWQWRQQLSQAHETFQMELSTASTSAYVHLALVPCLKQRLEKIAAELDRPGPSWRGMAERLNFPGAPETTPIAYHSSYEFNQLGTEGWTNALANGTVSHLSNYDAWELGQAYAATRQLAANEVEESKASAKLAPLGTDRPMSPDMRAAMLQTVFELRRVNAAIRRNSEDILLAVRTARFYSAAELRTNNAEFLKLEREFRGSCVAEPALVSLPGIP